jgi:PAS domain S-box-containing protein
MGIEKEKSQPPEAAELRRRAEKELQTKAGEARPPRSEKESQRLLHELEVHQIELEMQNEELRHARDETERALEMYSDLYDFAPVGYFTLDREGTIHAVNLAGGRLLSVERSLLISRPFAAFLSYESRPVFQDFLNRVFTSEMKMTCELVFQKGDRPPLCSQIEAVACSSGVECRMAVIDISELKRVQEELAAKINQLECALSKVKLLEGIIPICTCCKRIMDDKDKWQQMEKYISQHSEALFSHGYCPECYEKEIVKIKMELGEIKEG